MVLYAATFQHAGFVLATVVFMGATLLLFRATRPLLSLVTVVATVAGIYAIFILFLRLPVPLWPAF